MKTHALFLAMIALPLTSYAQQAPTSQETIDFWLRATETTYAFYRARLGCALGNVDFAEAMADGMKTPEIAGYCTAVRHRSAEVQFDSNLRAERPDMDILAPYRSSAVYLLGLDETDENARKVLSEITSVLPQVPEDFFGLVEVSMSSGEKAPLNPTAAMEYGFTLIVDRAFQNLSSPPLPRRSREQLTPIIKACQEAERTVKECFEVGQNDAALILQTYFANIQSVNP